MKKFLSVTLCLILCLICLCGCASVSYYVDIGESNEIIQYFTIKFDETIAKQTNADMNSIKNKLYNSVASYFNTLKENFIYRGDYPIVEKQLWLRSNTGTLANVQLNYYYPDNYTYTYTLTFANISAYAYFYGIDLENSTPEYTYDSNPFFNTRIETSHTVYFGLEESALITTWEEIYKSEFNNQFDSSNINYQFIFLENEAHIRSDADDVVYKDEQYYHIFNMSLQETSRDIHFYKYTIKAEAWYISALLLTLVFVIILLIVNAIKIQSNKRKLSKIKAVENVSENLLENTPENSPENQTENIKKD